MRTRVGVGVLLLAVVAGLTVAGPGVAPASAHQVLMTRSTPSTVAGGATVAATMLLPGTDPGESVHCGGAVLDVDVSVRIRHDDNSQLDVRLEHAGVGRILFLALGGSGVDVRIDDEAPQSLTQLPTNGTPPYGVQGTGRPGQQLAGFDGTPVGGEWTLRIRNDASQSAILEGWSVRVSCASEGELQATTLQLPAVPGSVLDGTASVSGELPADACVGPVTDVNVVVQATTPRADLTAVEVTAPNGSTVLLKGGAMQSQGAGIWVVFDDEAASSIDQAAPVGQAPFNLLEWARPAEPLALFDGLPGAGTWTVTARSLGAANGVVDLHLAMIDVVCADVATDVASGPLAVPQDVLRTSTITVPAERCAGPVEDVDVQVVMANRGNDDVTLLVEHDGVRVALKGLGGSTLPGIRGVFDDEAADPFMTRPGLMAFDPYRARGAFRPAAPLSALDGLAAEGAWTLEVTSTTPAELQVWSLAITCGAGPGGPSDDRVVVLAGPSRVETAVEVSQDRHAAGSADVAVLARADAFADALAGAPLAVAVGGPLLLTQPDSLHPATAAELQRVLDPGGTVVLLGGTAALADEVADAVAGLGFAVERAAGPSRVETAVAIAEQVEAHAGAPASVLLATGETFPHALVAGAAAPQLDGVLLLTSGAAAHPATQGWLADHPGIVRYAVGAPARAAHPEAQGVGDDSAAGTAVAVADLLGADPTVVGIASSEVFADALGGGAHIGAAGGPLLLTGPDDLADEAAAWLTDHAATVDTAYVYGGDAAISPAVRAAVASAIAG